MAQNNKAPATGMARALVNVASQADTIQIAPNPIEIQKRRLLNRYNFSPALAEAIAALAYGTPNTGDC